MGPAPPDDEGPRFDSWLMSTLSARPQSPAPKRWTLRRRAVRFVVMAVGWSLLAVGIVGAVLPGHLGVPLVVVGLIIVLRSSRQVRRQFIGLQRRHPRYIFPIRRLLRRKPEILPVFWQQMLRMERLLLPRRWRPARSLRRRILGRKGLWRRGHVGETRS